MARGWESKSVEAQQDAAVDHRHVGPPVSPAERTVRTQRQTLMLARTKALSDLQRACVPAHRALLELAIADIDRQLEQLT